MIDTQPLQKQNMKGASHKFLLLLGVVLISTLLSYSSTKHQVFRLSMDYIESTEVKLHNFKMNEISNRSVTYIHSFRVLSVVFTELLHRITKTDVSKALIISALFVRILIFVLCFYVFLGFRLGIMEALFALFYIYYSINASFYNENLNMMNYENLYFMFFLLFILLTIHNKDPYLIPVVILGSLAKETAVMFPLFYLIYRFNLDVTDIKSILKNNIKLIVYTIIMLLSSLIVYLSIRYFLSGNSFDSLRTMRQNLWGFGMLTYSILKMYPRVISNWLAMFNILLLLPFFYWDKKDAKLKRLLIVFMPLFLLPHLLTARLDEVRLFYIYLIILLPLSIDTLNRAVEYIRRDSY
jgi:hypothetical protein